MAEEKEKPKCKQCEEGKSCIKIFQNTRLIKTVIFMLLGVTLFLFGHHLLFGKLPYNCSYTCWILGFCFGGITFLVFLLTYLPQRIIGNYVYYFKDKDKTIHCHKEMPIRVEALGRYCWKTPPKDAVQWNAEDFKIVGPLIRVKAGGWLKKSKVRPDRDMVETGTYFDTRESSVQFNKKECFDISSHEGSLIGIPIEQVFDVFEKIGGMHLLMYKSFITKETEQKMKQAQTIRDDLAYQMLAMLIKIHDRRDSMGKSKHARELRLDIEKALTSVPNAYERLTKWQMLFVDPDELEKAQEVIIDLIRRYMPDLIEEQPEEQDLPKAATG